MFVAALGGRRAGAQPVAMDPPAPTGLRIDHEPVACVLGRAYSRMQVVVTPPEDVAGVQLRFTTEGSKG